MPTNTAIVPAPTTSSEHVSTVSDGDASYQPNASPASAFPNPETRSRNKKYPHGFAGSSTASSPINSLTISFLCVSNFLSLVVMYPLSVSRPQPRRRLGASSHLPSAQACPRKIYSTPKKSLRKDKRKNKGYRAECGKEQRLLLVPSS